MTGHPTWCDPQQCTATRANLRPDRRVEHRSAETTTTLGAITATAWLSQEPGRAAVAVIVAAWDDGGTTTRVPLQDVRQFGQALCLLGTERQAVRTAAGRTGAPRHAGTGVTPDPAQALSQG